jgi:hypothetical protein
MAMTLDIWCCGCAAQVPARLTDGKEVYPHRRDLVAIPFWKCNTCSSHVGCHHRTVDRTRPLGCIPTPALRRARVYIHALLDPLWKSGLISRSAIYGMLSQRLGIEQFHTADIRTIEEARITYRFLRDLAASLHAPGSAGGTQPSSSRPLAVQRGPTKV